MRIACIALLLALGVGSRVSAQEKIAEGEYLIVVATASDTSKGQTISHWVLFDDHSGHFRLESEIQRQRSGMRVIQVENLSEGLVPTAIGYDFYRKDDQVPSITAKCEFSSGSMVCTGHSAKDEAAPNTPYKIPGPFWMWIEGLSSCDLPWLIDGGINLAHLEKGGSSLFTLVVSGGSGVMIGDAINIAALQSIGKPLKIIAPDKPIPWSFRSAEESSVSFVGLESAQFQGSQVAVRHYTLNGSDNQGDIWITTSGLLTKLVMKKETMFVLSSFKQFRQIVPELAVEKVGTH